MNWKRAGLVSAVAAVMAMIPIAVAEPGVAEGKKYEGRYGVSGT